MKSGFYIVDAVAHYWAINGTRHSLCGVEVVSLTTPYDPREHRGVTPMCRQCQEAIRADAVRKAMPVQPDVDACTCAACRESTPGKARAKAAQGA